MIQPATPDAFRLFYEGAIALAQVEGNGIRVDTDYLEKSIEQTANRIKSAMASLKEDEVYRVWRRRFGQKTSLTSTDQLRAVIYEELGYPVETFSDTGKPSVDESALEKIDLPFIRNYTKLSKLVKAKNTYLEGIRREVVDGYMHPVFNLHFVDTYRSSSDTPNFQNIPIRNPEIGKLIRQCFRPRPGRVLLEVDYGQQEFKVAASFWGDPGMVDYASDPAKDVHRDYAALCYACHPDNVSKPMRGVAKNSFVFPVLYGSDYINCSRNMWEELSTSDLKLKDGKSVKEHLASKGIRELGELNRKQRPRPGTFENHVQQVERGFYKQFPTFDQRKREWWDAYLRQGWFELPTGFIAQGVFSRNFLMNCPIQGSGFHCLLWSLIRLQEWLNKYNMATLIVGQIHDCILLDVPEDELQDVLNVLELIMTTKLRQHYKWILTPMLVEVDVVNEDETWYDKKPWVKKEGTWVLKI